MSSAKTAELRRLQTFALYVVRMGGIVMPRVIVFDVNETLLDLRALEPHFRRIFGNAAVLDAWFAQVLLSALVATVTDTYSDFGTIGGEALDVISARLGVDLSANDRARIREGMLTLPPHPEVSKSLSRLRDADLRLATLTNSTTQAARAQLTNAELIDYFEIILSVEAVRRFKPAAETYRMAAKELGVDIGDIRLVAAHDWDIAGAMRAGCTAAFIARPGKVLGPSAERPDIVGKDLREVTDQILEKEL
jgi:2-haloacid dehalogenase